MPDERPNILFIIDDQHRYDWLGCAGADWVRTPHIDALAAQGMRLTHCHTNSPVCAPARISLATGLLPTRLGATSNAEAFLPISQPNMYRHFRDHGYRVSLVGRHDLAKTGAPASIYGNRPLNFSYGFTEAFEVEGGMAMSGLGEPNGPYGRYLQERGLLEAYCADFRKRAKAGWNLGASHDSVLDTTDHQDVFVGRKAVERIESIEDDYPWFMFVSFQGPHDPFDPPAEYGAMYRDMEIPEPIRSDPAAKPRRLEIRRKQGPDKDIREARRQYAAKLTLIDDQVGNMVKALERRGCLENTIVVFCSDHGEMLGDHDLWIKHCAYEPSWRVPCVITGPGIEQGITDSLVELSDLNPTLVELAGLPAQPNLDARSFTAVLHGKMTEHRDCVVTTERSPVPSQGSYRAIRTQKYKLILTDNDRTELYDMQEDPCELRNIAAEQSRTVQELKQRLIERYTEGRWMR